jgi:hypothetical protein
MSTPYNFWISQAKRWDSCINFGSPISAWSLDMLKEYDAAKAEGRPPSLQNCPDRQPKPL